MASIVVTRPLPGSAVAALEEAFGKDSVWVYDGESAIPREVLLEQSAGTEAVLAILTERIDREFFEAAGPQLRIVANMAVGYDNVDVEEATRRGVAITNTPGVLTETTADLAWTLLLGAARRLGESERFLRAGRWQDWSPTLLLGVDVHDATLGIFGLGRIGQAVARRAQGFGMRILYHNRNRAPEAVESELGAVYVDKAALVSESDFLSIHCPLTEDTRRAFGTREFQQMKPTAVLVNTARGPIVDEAALADALEAGELFAAGLDVFADEPRVHPKLLERENALLLPHLGSASQATRARMARIAADNIIARLNGEDPPNCVNTAVLA